MNIFGKMNSLTGKNALEAKADEKVLFITSRANRDTRINHIGAHADLVWLGGSLNDRPASNDQLWPFVGVSTVTDFFQFRLPGTKAYLYL